ncbi:MAG TPA: flagellar hook-associated protein FlgL [Candidatus Binatia bacterium]|jgi:flagellar hook-associated protein 3 FlgL
MILGRVTQATVFQQLTSSVGRLQRQLARTQEEVSSQKKLLNASDDPAGAAQANRLRGETSTLQALDGGIGFGTAVLGAEDGALDQAGNLLTRAQEIATQQSSGLSTPAARQQASEEVAQIERGMLTLANTQVAGRYVFGGLASGTQPFANLDDPGFDPTTAYSGSTTPFTLPLGAGQTVALTTPGDQVFGSTLTALDHLRTTLASGAPPNASVDELNTAADTLRAERASVGGRVTRLQDRSTQIGRLTDTATGQLSGVEDVDLTTAISQLVQLQTALQATLASGSAVQQSILDYLPTS